MPRVGLINNHTFALCVVILSQRERVYYKKTRLLNRTYAQLHKLEKL